MQRPELNGPLVWSVLFIVVAALAIVMTLPPLLTAAFSPDSGAAEMEQQFTQLMERHEDSLALHQNRFNGRSIFFEPKLPPKPVERRPVRREPTPPPPPPRETPKVKPSYAGPALKGMVGQRLCFAGGLVVHVGQERDGLRALEANPPWTAKVEYRGWEYDLTLFDRPSDDAFFKRLSTTTASFPGIIEAPTDAATDPETPGEPAAEEPANARPESTSPEGDKTEAAPADAVGTPSEESPEGDEAGHEAASSTKTTGSDEEPPPPIPSAKPPEADQSDSPSAKGTATKRPEPKPARSAAKTNSTGTNDAEK